MEPQTRSSHPHVPNVSDGHLRLALDIDTVGIFFLDETGAIRDGNEAFLRMSGYHASDLRTRGVRWDVMTPVAWRARTRQAIAELWRTGTLTPFEKPCVRRDGTEWWSLVSAKLLNGVAIVYLIDVTDRKRAEAHLHESEERQAFLLRLSDALRDLDDPRRMQAVACRLLGQQLDADRVLSGLLDDDGEWAEISDDYHRPGLASAAGRYRVADFGVSGVEVLRAGKSLVVSDALADPSLGESERAAFAASGFRAGIVVPLLRARRYVAFICAHSPEPRRWASHEIELVAETGDRLWEAIERGRAERALRESEARYRALAAATSDVVYRMSPDWRELRRLDGRGFLADTLDPVSDWLAGYVLPEDQAEFTAAIERSIATREVFELEHRVRQADGGVGWTLSRAVPVLDRRGDVVEWVGTASDVTERRRADMARREIEERRAFLLRLNDALRQLTDPAEMQLVAGQILGERLDAGRVLFGEFTTDDDMAVVKQEYRRPDMSSGVGNYPLGGFGAEFEVELKAGRPLFIQDAVNHPGLTPGERAAFAAWGVRAAVSIPRVREGRRFISFVLLHSPTPREWTEPERQLILETADRLWDAIERALAESALRASEERYRTLFTTMDQGFCIVERIDAGENEPIDFRYVTVNPACETQSGMAPKVGQTFRELVPNIDPELPALYDEVLRSGEPRRFEEHVQPIGRWIEAEVFPAAEAGQLAVLFRDVTERKRAERDLAESEERFRTIAEQAEVGLAMADHDGSLIYVNDRTVELIDASRDRLLASSIRDVTNAEDWPENARAYDRMLADGTPFTVEKRFVRADGQPNWTRVTVSPRRDGDGVITGGVAVILDITERRHAEEQVRASEERQSLLVRLGDALRTITDAAELQATAARLVGEHLGVDRAYFSDVLLREGTIVVQPDYARPGLASVAGGYTHSDFFDRPSALREGKVLVVPDLATSEVMSERTRAALGARGFGAFVAAPLVRDGGLSWTLNVVSETPRAWTAEEVDLVVEVGERTWRALRLAASEQRTRESDARFQALFERMSQSYCEIEMVFDGDRAVDYVIQVANPRYWDLTGLSDVIGRSIRATVPGLEQHWFDFYGQVARTGQAAHIEQEAAPLGRWYTVYAWPLPGPDPNRVAVLFDDITARKRTEAARQEEKELAERAVDARDRFLSIGAHELRTPVTSLKGTVDLLDRARRLGTLTPERIEHYATRMTEDTRRLQGLVDELFDVSRLHGGGADTVRRYAEPTDLAALIERTIDQHWHGARRARLQVDLARGPDLLLQPERIRQVVVNLVENALKYSPDGERVDITLTRDLTGATLRVSDQGIGLPVGSEESIFEPFSRAPNAVASTIPGLGLGLYICREIVQTHGGRLWVVRDGEELLGTTMALWLPALATDA